MNNTIISFIIPAYNEESRIHNTIEAAIDNAPCDCEIIVVDHGSDDNTLEIVKEFRVVALSHPDGSIASLRNYGAQHATGDILVFIDADVLLTENWAKRFREVSRNIAAGRRILTGSWVSVPKQTSWIERNWFKPLQKGASTHINSGHLIVAKKLFDEIGGFDENLETGEDYEISIRAKSCGVDVVDDVLLEAVHEGYPKTLKEFFSREVWHGKGDMQSLKSIMNSKIAIVSLLLLGLHILLVLFVVLAGSVFSFAIVILLILSIVFFASAFKYRGERISVILVNAFLYYVYFIARAFSLTTLFYRKEIIKHHR